MRSLHRRSLAWIAPSRHLGFGARSLVGEPFTSSVAVLDIVVNLVWIVIALAFLAEFVVRTIVAPETWVFLRKHWWEVGLIALPFLRFLRVLRAGRAGRGIASAVHSSRSAGARLRSRLTSLVVVTTVVGSAGGPTVVGVGGYQGLLRMDGCPARRRDAHGDRCRPR